MDTSNRPSFRRVTGRGRRPPRWDDDQPGAPHSKRADRAAFTRHHSGTVMAVHEAATRGDVGAARDQAGVLVY